MACNYININSLLLSSKILYASRWILAQIVKDWMKFKHILDFILEAKTSTPEIVCDFNCVIFGMGQGMYFALWGFPNLTESVPTTGNTSCPPHLYNLVRRLPVLVTFIRPRYKTRKFPHQINKFCS